MELDIRNAKMLKAKKVSLDIEECQWNLGNGTLSVWHRDIDAKIPLNEIDKITFITDGKNPLRKRHISIHHFEASKPVFIFTSQVDSLLTKSNPVQTARLQILFDDIAVWSRENEAKIEWTRNFEVDERTQKLTNRIQFFFFLLLLISTFISLLVAGNPLAFVFIFVFAFILIAYKAMYPAPKIYRISKEFISREIE